MSSREAEPVPPPSGQPPPGGGADEAAAHSGTAGAGKRQRPAPLKRTLDFFDSTTKVLLAAGGLIAAAAALWAAISHLVPAPSPPARHQFVVAPESCGALTFGADGAAGPVTCPDGRPNIAADHYYRRLHLRVLDLGPHVTPVQVHAAVCADMATGTGTFPVEADAVKLAEAEQDWHFGVDPASEVGPGMCPAS